MKVVRLIVAVSVLLFSFAAFGQASHVSVSASALGFSGGGQTSAATIVGGSAALTKRASIAYQQVILPSIGATYYLGDAQYTMPFSALVGKKINSSLVFDSSKWSATFFGGAGVVRQNVAGVMQQHVATNVGVGLNYAADGHLSVQVVSGQWLHGFVAGPAANQFVYTPNNAAISTGLQLTF